MSLTTDCCSWQRNLPADFSVCWDGEGNLMVMVSHQHAGHLCGMCGDYDGDPSDDFRNQFGALTTDVNLLAHSWFTDVSTPCCAILL